jgi:hypothetical protein
MRLETVLGSIRSVADLPSLVVALGHTPLCEPVPDDAWNKTQQRLLQVTAVGQADGLWILPLAGLPLRWPLIAFPSWS